MTKQEIKDFIVKANGKPCPIYFPQCPVAKALGNTIAYITDSKYGKRIYVYQNFFYYNYLYQQYVILHELGHINDPNSRHSSGSKAELFAITWAINKAKQLGLLSLVKFCKQELNNWQSSYSKYHRVYYLAYKLAKQQGII